MYDGTTAVKAAASKAGLERFVTSLVSKYEAIAANAEKMGARKTLRTGTCEVAGSSAQPL